MKNFIKGLLIGIGKILPGISGSMLAISFGVYKHMLYCVSNISLLRKKDIIFMSEICLGIITSIFLLAKVILILYNNYFHIIVSIFTGIIFGGQIKNIINTKIKLKYLFFLIILLLIILNINLPKLNVNINPLSLFFLGILEAFAMIIPGISGTSIFIYIGAYKKILNILSDISKYKLLFCFSCGVGFGILFLSKIISILIKKNEKKFEYMAIMLTVITSLSIVKKVFLNLNNANEIILILVLFIFSLITSFYLSE